MYTRHVQGLLDVFVQCRLNGRVLEVSYSMGILGVGYGAMRGPSISFGEFLKTCGPGLGFRD